MWLHEHKTSNEDSEDEYWQIVETSVTVNNSPIQDYIHPDDHARPIQMMKLHNLNLAWRLNQSGAIAA